MRLVCWFVLVWLLVFLKASLSPGLRARTNANYNTSVCMCCTECLSQERGTHWLRSLEPLIQDVFINTTNTQRTESADQPPEMLHLDGQHAPTLLAFLSSCANPSRSHPGTGSGRVKPGLSRSFGNLSRI